MPANAAFQPRELALPHRLLPSFDLWDSGLEEPSCAPTVPAALRPLGTRQEDSLAECDMGLGFYWTFSFHVLCSVTLSIRGNLVLYFTFSDVVHKKITVFMAFNSI